MCDYQNRSCNGTSCQQSPRETTLRAGRCMKKKSTVVWHGAQNILYKKHHANNQTRIEDIIAMHSSGCP